MRHIKLGILAAVLAISGCEQSAQAETPDAQIDVEMLGEWGVSEVRVIQDKKRGVICWIYAAPNRGGIHCIPDWMLDRGAVEPESLEGVE